MSVSNTIELSRLRHIVAVADTGSFSAAAKSQNITQPALSRSIAWFEARHGLRLFDRNRGGVNVTPVGKFVIEQARTLLRSASELERDLTLYGRGAAGKVAIGLGPLLASLLLPELSRNLLQTRPNLEVITTVKSPDALLSDLFSDEIELILGNSWLVGEMPGISIEPLGAIRLAVVVRAGHPLAKAHASQMDLAAYPIAHPVRPTDEAIHAGAFVCDNYHILRETVATTDCTWITAPAFVQGDVQAGRLAILDIEGMDIPDSPISVISRVGRSRSPAAEAIIEQVAAKLTQDRSN